MATIHGEILGLKASNNGRSCAQHLCCGRQVTVGDVVVFRLCQVVDDLTDENEDAIKEWWYPSRVNKGALLVTFPGT